MTVPAAASLALLAGLFVAAQAAALGPLSRVVPPSVAALWVQLGGAVVAAAVVAVRSLPLSWPGAAIGLAVVAGGCTVGIVTAIAASVMTLGLGATIATVTGAQLLFGLALDAAGATGRAVPITWSRALGAVLIFAGCVLVLERSGT